MNEILRGTLFSWAYKLFGINGDIELLNRMNVVFICYTVVVIVSSIVKPIPYGRYSQSLMGPTMNAKFAWMFQEVPAFLVPLILLIQTPCASLSSNANLIALIFFMVHYFNRSFIFSSRMITAKPVPIFTAVMAFIFCSFNGLLQGHHLTNVNSIDSPLSFRVVGVTLFITGMLTNIYHDGILLSLRKNSGKDDEKSNEKYKIPKGGLFETISCPNYFGEILEWWGLFVITLGTPQLVFAIFTTSFLGIRAWHHHGWYKKTFVNYPKNRKAVIPFVL